MNKADKEDVAFGKRWERIASAMNMHLRGWTYDQSATLYMTGGAIIEFRGTDFCRMLPHLEKIIGERR